MISESEISQAIEHVFSIGLASADERELLRQLDAELQQQTHAQALVLDGGPPDPWVLGGDGGGGFGPMAQRFLNFYADAIHREICDPDKPGMKDSYRVLMGGVELQDRVKTLVPAILAAVGLTASLVTPAVIAVIVALWLIRVGLDHWCALPRPAGAPAPEQATPAAAAPTPPDRAEQAEGAML